MSSIQDLVQFGTQTNSVVWMPCKHNSFKAIVLQQSFRLQDYKLDSNMRASSFFFELSCARGSH